MKTFKLYIFLISVLVFSSCDLIFPDKEEPVIDWLEFRINDNGFKPMDSLYIAYELIEFKVNVYDDASEISNVQLYLSDLSELDSIIYSTNVALKDDIYLLKWNTTDSIFINGEYNLYIKAIDSNDNEKVSSSLILTLDQSIGYPDPVEMLSVINRENENCLYWVSAIIDSIPDFSHYNIYNSIDDLDSNLISINTIETDFYCHSEFSNTEKFYNIEVVDIYGFKSEQLEYLSNLEDYPPIPLSFVNIVYDSVFINFEWEESPDDIDFDYYELWFRCIDCESNDYITIEGNKGRFYIGTERSNTSLELNIFDSIEEGENPFSALFPNKYNEFWIRTYDIAGQASLSDHIERFVTVPDKSPQSVNIRSLDYSVDGINIEWYLNEKDTLDFKSYNLYHSITENENKNKLFSVFSIDSSSVFIDSSFVSEYSIFTFKNDFNPFVENWFWIGVEDIYGNISIGSGITNLIDIPPPEIGINDWSKRIRNDSTTDIDTIILYWENISNFMSDFKSYTIYMDTVPNLDIFEDSIGIVTEAEENSFMFSYDWYDKVDCNQSGELHFWSRVEDAWGQKTISQSIQFSEEPPTKPSITSLYYESIGENYVLEWNISLDDDFKKYTVYYKHQTDLDTDGFTYSDIFGEDCEVEHLFHDFDDPNFHCVEICKIEIDDFGNNNIIYNLKEQFEERTMYFLVVTEDIWGMQSISTVQLECDSADPECNIGGEKATPYNQIVFQSNKYGETNIYSVELDLSDILIPTLLSGTIGDSYAPVFEPLGARIIYYGMENGNYEIFSSSAGGSNTPQNLTNNPGNDFNPQYLSNGTRIIFESHRDGDLELYSMNKDGTDLIQLTFNNGIDRDFNIAKNIGPDKIVYSSTSTGNLDVFVMNEDGTSKQNITNHPEPEYDPDISDDGEQIVYIGEFSNQVDLFWYNIVTGDSIKLTNDNAVERNPQFILNGFVPFGEINNNNEFVIYESNLDGSWSLYIIKLPNIDEVEEFVPIPIDNFAISSSDQSNPSFAEIVLDLENSGIAEGQAQVFMVYESTQNGSRSIYLTNQDNINPIKISDDSGGDDFYPQIQP